MANIEGIWIMAPNKAFQGHKNTQEQIKQMCIEYSKTYFKPSDTEALLKYFEENNDKLKFYIDEQGKPNFLDGWTNRIPRVRFNEA